MTRGIRLLKPALLLSTYILASQAIKPPAPFDEPTSDAVDNVNPMIGNGGDSPNGSGGMIPSTAPPFAMTRWVAQTRQNYVSVTPYNYTATTIHGFQGTHQPAIWMGESGQAILAVGAGEVKSVFEERGQEFSHDDEVVSVSYYRVNMTAPEGGYIVAEQSATSRVGHLRFTFNVPNDTAPYALLEATRPSVMGSADPTNYTYPSGSIAINASAQEITGHNPERQDFIIGPNPASNFAGYFCARFSQPFASFGTAQNGTLYPGEAGRNGTMLSGWATFANGTGEVEARVGVSFISVEQARWNLENEVPDGTALEETARSTRAAWAEKLDRIQVEGATTDELATFYTAFFHTLQYPYEQDENGMYYSGYDEQVHEGPSYNGYSNWDIYRAQWAWLILFAPERVPDMITSMLHDYLEGGWLPMWKNIVETNIMIATHADSMIAEAVLKGVTGFDINTAWEAVYKDETVPPVNDTTTIYSDRQEGVGYEVNAGLSSVYNTSGWVANDIHSEAGSRTLDFAYDDYATALFAAHLNLTANATFFLARSFNAFTIWNNATGFMEARNASGAFAGSGAGWTEGDDWIYTLDVVQHVPELIEKMGGNGSFVAYLDEYFGGGHNDQTNEPSHHAPYLYSLAGAASRAQSWVRSIAESNYNSTVDGESGNDDCGQMSAWYLFAALGFYPVNPVALEFVVGSPFYDKITIDFPTPPNTTTSTQNQTRKLTVSAPGAPTKQYIKSLTVNGESLSEPIIPYAALASGGTVEFEMSRTEEAWGSATVYNGTASASP